MMKAKPTGRLTWMFIFQIAVNPNAYQPISGEASWENGKKSFKDQDIDIIDAARFFQSAEFSNDWNFPQTKFSISIATSKRLPWDSGIFNKVLMPINNKNMKAYKGINMLILSIWGAWETREYVTFNQCQKMGWKIKKG